MFAASPAYQVVTTINSSKKIKTFDTICKNPLSSRTRNIIMISLMQTDDQLLEGRPIWQCWSLSQKHQSYVTAIFPHKTLDIATPNIPNDRRKVKHWRKHCLHYQQKISPPLHFDGMSFVHVRGSSLNTATVIQDKRFCSSGKWGSTSIGSAIFNNVCLGHLFSSERILHNKMTLWYSWYVSYVD